MSCWAEAAELGRPRRRRPAPAAHTSGLKTSSPSGAMFRYGKALDFIPRYVRRDTDRTEAPEATCGSHGSRLVCTPSFDSWAQHHLLCFQVANPHIVTATFSGFNSLPIITQEVILMASILLGIFVMPRSDRCWCSTGSVGLNPLHW